MIHPLTHALYTLAYTFLYNHSYTLPHTLDTRLYNLSFTLPPPDTIIGQSLSSSYQLRLKRNNKQLPANTNLPQHDHDGSHLSALGCAYSCYLVTISHLLCQSLSKGPSSRRRAAPTTQRIIEEYTHSLNQSHHSYNSTSVLDPPSEHSSPHPSGPSLSPGPSPGTSPSPLAFATVAISSLSIANRAIGTATGGNSTEPSPDQRRNLLPTAEPSPDQRERRTSIASNSTLGDTRSRSASVATSPEDFAKNIESAKMGLKVCFEVLSSLSRFQEVPDDIVYRSMADACGACGCPTEAIDLLVRAYPPNTKHQYIPFQYNIHTSYQYNIHTSSQLPIINPPPHPPS